MGGDDVDETMGLLSKRRSFLASLQDSPKEKPALASDCGVARSTVDRAIRELEVAGLVDRGDDGFELTIPGRLVFDQFRAFERSIDAICSADDWLPMLPRHDIVDPVMLLGGEVTRADIHAPDKAMQETLDLVSTAARVRGVSPAVHGAYVETFDDRIQNEGMDTDLVFSADALTELTTTYAEYMRKEFPENVSIYQIDELPPLGLMLVDHEDGTTEASFGLYTDNGVQVVVRNTADAAVDWLTREFEAYRDRATEIQL
ncbi:helix-turn-helix transcriptional regulator [Haloarchaeobius sp. HRN-SO-5]|uniref:helix-turn-helix transcriptional regulator n=1 Tax=Haloarchaeobius sp. HRN-SO-5 TaxID=3446118 RepID=UPI003EB91236